MEQTQTGFQLLNKQMIDAYIWSYLHSIYFSDLLLLWVLVEEGEMGRVLIRGVVSVWGFWEGGSGDVKEDSKDDENLKSHMLWCIN